MRGEIGTLEQVLLSKIEPYNRCHLVIEFRRMTYVGTLVFDDVMFCHQLLRAFAKSAPRQID